MTGSIVNIIILTASVVLLSFLVAFIIVATLGANKIAADERIEELRKKEGDVDDIALIKNETKSTRRKKEVRKRSDFFEKVAEALYKQLVAADIKMRPEEYITVWILVTVIPASLVVMLLKNPIVAIALFLAGAFLPFFIIKSKKKSRVKRFELQLSDALMMACSSLKSGLSFIQAMETIARDMDDPIAGEFRTVIAEMGLGTSMDDALERLNMRIRSNYVSLMVSAVLVQRQTGGNLSEILENISNTIKERIKLKQELKSSIAAGLMTGVIVGFMPVALLIMFSITNWELMQPMFTTSRGRMFLYAAAALEGLCFFAIKKITTVKM